MKFQNLYQTHVEQKKLKFEYLWKSTSPTFFLHSTFSTYIGKVFMKYKENRSHSLILWFLRIFLSNYIINRTHKHLLYCRLCEIWKSYCFWRRACVKLIICQNTHFFVRYDNCLNVIIFFKFMNSIGCINIFYMSTVMGNLKIILFSSPRMCETHNLAKYAFFCQIW